MKTVISYFLFLMLVSSALSLKMGKGRITTSVRSSHDPNWYRNVLVAIEKSIKTAYASAHDQRRYKNVYVDTKSGIDLTRAERQYCFAAIFDDMVKECLATNEGNKYICKVIYPDCAVVYSDTPMALDPIANP